MLCLWLCLDCVLVFFAEGDAAFLFRSALAVAMNRQCPKLEVIINLHVMIGNTDSCNPDALAIAHCSGNLLALAPQQNSSRPGPWSQNVSRRWGIFRNFWSDSE